MVSVCTSMVCFCIPNLDLFWPTNYKIGAYSEDYNMIYLSNNTTDSFWVQGCHCNPEGGPQYNTLATSRAIPLYLSFPCPLQLVPLSARQLAHTHPRVSVSVCVPVSLHEPLLSWLSGVRCLGGRKDHEGMRYSHINVWYWQSGPQCTTLVCSGVWWQRSTVFDTKILNILFYK